MWIGKLVCAVVIFFGIWEGNAHAQCDITSYNPKFGSPQGYTADQGFKGKFDYPANTTEPEPGFLKAQDFTKDWRAYLDAVLNYSFEGNEDGTEAGVPEAFKVQNNQVRHWYHGLWMDRTPAGREFMHGLTAEKTSVASQLAPSDPGKEQTWAVGFYNEIGATTFAKVFKNPCQPDVSDVRFPEGTVSFKLLFSTAEAPTVPYLQGSPTWLADISRAQSPNRTPKSVRLIQVDVAVRDSRAGKTGWVFGTYVYSNEVQSSDPWRRLKPVGLMWGEDEGAKLGDPMTQSRINEDLKGVTYGWNERLVMGWKGRTNGPVDNLLSSCESCHGSAQFPRSDDFGNFPTKAVDDSGYAQRLKDYFRDIAPGEVFDPITTFKNNNTQIHAVSMDYSLQIQNGLERLCAAAAGNEKPFDTEPVPAVCIPSSWSSHMAFTNSHDQTAQRKELESIDWDFLSLPIR